ncbi:hypothetical protein SAMN04487917_10457 [Arthrobacter sp. yr096]|uniref:hypothetical protein n=1 Tax=Arthrobacter sp. yr096 TaxID=1761750 RepID=UPI0008B8FA71|nr:hypothetical protein [Arthrobacter sp. yr096]SEJ15573.1 hypothetical protein SAMN04487917_10457 [Arthrobacter sp. yr096]
MPRSNKLTENQALALTWRLNWVFPISVAGLAISLLLVWSYPGPFLGPILVLIFFLAVASSVAALAVVRIKLTSMRGSNEIGN